MAPFFVLTLLYQHTCWLIASSLLDEGHYHSNNGQNQKQVDENPDNFKYQTNDPAYHQYCGNDKK
jgi:hypothetical protein